MFRGAKDKWEENKNNVVAQQEKQRMAADYPFQSNGAANTSWEYCTLYQMRAGSVALSQVMQSGERFLTVMDKKEYGTQGEHLLQVVASRLGRAGWEQCGVAHEFSQRSGIVEGLLAKDNPSRTADIVMYFKRRLS